MDNCYWKNKKCRYQRYKQLEHNLMQKLWQ